MQCLAASSLIESEDSMSRVYAYMGGILILSINETYVNVLNSLLLRTFMVKNAMMVFILEGMLSSSTSCQKYMWSMEFSWKASSNASSSDLTGPDTLVWCWLELGRIKDLPYHQVWVRFTMSDSTRAAAVWNECLCKCELGKLRMARDVTHQIIVFDIRYTYDSITSI